MHSAKIFCWSCLAVFLAWSVRAHAADMQIRETTQTTSQGAVAVKTFFAADQGRHPAVVILHGSQGLEKFRAFYERNAASLARAGFNAYLLSYYNAQDAACAKTVEQRRANFAKRITAWSLMVSDVVTSILADGRNTRAVGLVGYSQGGFLGVDVASRDDRVSALVVFYGGIPPARSPDKHRPAHMPPLLELHGDADATVPMERGKELVDMTRSLGQSAEMVVYPGAGHGFGGATATDAEQRTLAFFQARLARHDLSPLP